jgi:hypothetical protein
VQAVLGPLSLSFSPSVEHRWHLQGRAHTAFYYCSPQAFERLAQEMGLMSTDALFEQQNLSRLTELLKSHGELD